MASEGQSEMVPWWKRLVYSLVSFVIGGGTVGAVAACVDVLTNPGSHLGLVRMTVSACIILAFSLPGWIVAIPIVLLVRDYSGWRLWACAATGICIGPILTLGVGIYAFATDPRSGRFFDGISGFMVLASSVSVLTTAIYLLLVSHVLKGPIAREPA
jgi:hypothetical protein